VNCLAWYRYPEPDGTAYSERDLTDPKVVETLFDYGQLELAAISKQGWRHLMLTFGAEGLLGINRRSGWFDEDDAFDSLRYRCLLDGYDLERDLFGTYDEPADRFIDEAGDARAITWGERMDRVYGCRGASIESVAGRVAEALHITVTRFNSPMIGPWYQSAASVPSVMIQLNDSDPAYGPEYPGAGEVLIRVRARAMQHTETERALLACGLNIAPA